MLAWLPLVSAVETQPFPDIPFKVFSDFVSKTFSSQVSLSTVLLVLFSLTENPDLLNLHSRQKTAILPSEKNRTLSGWMTPLANALVQRLENKTKTLLKHKERPTDNPNKMTEMIALKLDQMTEILGLKPVYSKTSGHVKHKLSVISHQEISAIHLICPVSMQCTQSQCSPWALSQDTRPRDIPLVTLIKGTTIHKNVSVLSGLCTRCNTKYYADHIGLDQASSQKQIKYLNNAKYMKVGQSLWVDQTFGHAVVNGMYSFHGSAAAYTEYWNNTFGQTDFYHTAQLTRRHIWQAFMHESIRVIATNQNKSLQLNEKLAIDDVTRAAFDIFR